ncbi:MAG: DUF4124 domain-containing protein [Lysobacter sp.]
MTPGLARALLPAIVGMFPAIGLSSAHADGLTIYRCTDAQRQVTLRDTPCAKEQHQQTIDMVRPRDPPPRPAPMDVPPTPTRAASTPPATVIVLRALPQPVYECMTPDGERYTSDSPAGNPRWVPLWTLGYPVGPGIGHSHGGGPLIPPVRPATGSGQASAYTAQRMLFDSVGRPTPRPPASRPGISPQPPVGGAIIPILGSWISDQCQRLPPAEVCNRLNDRRWELDRRYNSAMQSERKRIDAEQRDIDARLASECTH